MADVLRIRRDTLANWTTVNPIIPDGQLTYATDTGAWKMGNGVDHWLDLSAMAFGNAVTALDMTATTDPGAAAAGHLTLYAKAIAGRVMAKIVGPSGLDTALQPFLARNKVGYWCPPGNATTLPGVFGYTAPTFVGTPTTRSVSTTNQFTRTRRLGYVSAATAGSLTSGRVAVAQITTGTGTLGGFHKIMRFGISDAAVVATARMFVGISTNVAAPTNVEPSTLTNCIGVGHGAADTNLKLFYGGSVAQTPIDLGVNFPSNTTNTDMYELALFSAPAGAGEIMYEVTRVNTGRVATGTISPAGGVALPGSTTLMTYLWWYRTNNATAAAVGFDTFSDYIETDS